ncbi:hypothetical protein BH09PLA1_BH09PLA1_25160 [soil metagenome]
MVMDDTNTIPFHVRLVRRDRIEDHLRHSLEFGVVGVNTPATVMIGSDFYCSPVVEERPDRGGIDLPDRLIDALALACYRLIVAYVTQACGECGTWTEADITPWIRKRFASEDAEQILRALSVHVTPGWEVRTTVVVGDDDVVLADDYR